MYIKPNGGNYPDFRGIFAWDLGCQRFPSWGFKRKMEKCYAKQFHAPEPPMCPVRSFSDSEQGKRIGVAIILSHLTTSKKAIQSKLTQYNLSKPIID